MVFLGAVCYALGIAVLVWSVVEARRLAAATRNKAWEKKAAVRRRAAPLLRRVRCEACAGLCDPSIMTEYGKDAAGATLFLCPSCKDLFGEK